MFDKKFFSLSELRILHVSGNNMAISVECVDIMGKFRCGMKLKVSTLLMQCQVTFEWSLEWSWFQNKTFHENTVHETSFYSSWKVVRCRSEIQNILKHFKLKVNNGSAKEFLLDKHFSMFCSLLPLKRLNLQHVQLIQLLLCYPYPPSLSFFSVA